MTMITINNPDGEKRKTDIRMTMMMINLSLGFVDSRPYSKSKLKLNSKKSRTRVMQKIFVCLVFAFLFCS